MSTQYRLLRGHGDEPLVDQFVRLYDAIFDDPDTREDPAIWRGRLADEQPIPAPIVQLVVAIEGSRVVGGVLFEYYRTSRCGLITYLLVDPSYRSKGNSRELVRLATRELNRTANALQVQLRAVFAEADKPGTGHSSARSIDSVSRYMAFAKLGWEVLEIPYVQPALGPGAQRARSLNLLWVPCMEQAASLAAQPPTGDVLKDFLQEFYSSLGVEHVANDADLGAIMAVLRSDETVRTSKVEQVLVRMASLSGPVMLEDPKLAWSDAGIVLHFVQQVPESERSPGSEGSAGADAERCPILGSMELDLLAYAFQTPPPFTTYCLTTSALQDIELRIVFPQLYSFRTEGRVEWRVCPRTEIRVGVKLSISLFQHTAIRIWHLALTQLPGQTLNELDIIRLIHLYDGRAEESDVAQQSYFQPLRVGRASDTQAESIVQAERLLEACVRAFELPDSYPTVTDGILPAGGTVQLICDPESGCRPDQLQKVRAFLRKRRGDVEKLRQQDEAPDDDKPGDLELGIGGVILGIFDLGEVSKEELADTLEPTFESDSSLIRVNRGTLTCLAREDRSQGTVSDNVGISPYLIIPHAALIHNDTLIDQALDVAAELAVGKHSIEQLESALRKVDSRLDRELLPNIFNYSTERQIFERGSDQRGSISRLSIARTQQEEIRSRLDVAWEARREWGQRWIASFLAFLSVILSGDSLTKLIHLTDRCPFASFVVPTLGIVAALIIFASWGGIRRAFSSSG